MVQRKVIDKLRIQADHSKHDHQSNLSITSLKKPFSSHHQDGKTRGPEVKKKMMKKSKSFKLSDVGQQSLKASSRNSISQPGKPPPTLDVTGTCPKALFTPKKQLSVQPRSLESSPNYMKSTSCFEARKESRSQTSFWSNGKLVSAVSGGKKAAKSSGSKLGVRTLTTKAPSFKLSRPGSAKKSSRVALCASRDHVEVRRATCSSTLKDSKFPSYLALNHGGTESDGTSVVKVCPYTYCSLNGHHHKLASLPPLKRFLSAKRRALKAQKSANSAVADKGIRDVDGDEALERVGMSFFVKIYAENEKKIGFVSSKVEEICIEEEQVVESLSDGSPQSEIDAEEALERCSEEIGLVEAGLEGNFGEDEAAERGFACFFPDMEETKGSYSSGSASDMEWEAGEFSEAEIDDESVSIFGCSLEIENSTSNLYEDGFSNCDVDMNEEFLEESAWFGDEFAEQESEQVDDILFVEQLSCNEDPCGDLSSGEGNLGEGEEIAETFKEPNVSEKTEESSDTDKQVDDTFDMSSESRVVFEQAEEGNKAANISEIEEEANVAKPEASIRDGLDDHSDAKLFASETNEESKGETRKKQPASQVDREIADEELRNKWSIGKRRIKDSDEDSTRKFNPREPNYLPLAENPEGEKVDLKHQEMDERKNSEDWMIDHALQQAVTKLGPARKRRVALLVEAFETVSPITKFEPRQPNRLQHHHHPTSPVFSHSIRPIQACN